MIGCWGAAEPVTRGAHFSFGRKAPGAEQRLRRRKETNRATYHPSWKSNCRHMRKGQGNLFCQLCALLLGD